MEIKPFTEEQKQIFQELGVLGVYLFGSQADGTANSESDVDFGVVLSREAKKDRTELDIYLKLYEVFLKILPAEYLRGRFEKRAHEFDVVFLQQAPPRIGFRSVMNGKVLYQSSSKATADFREEMMLRYFDFKYFENIYHQSFLAIPKHL